MRQEIDTSRLMDSHPCDPPLAAGSTAPACSPLPWTVEYDEAVKIKDARGNTVAILTHLHLRGRRSHEEVKANVERILSAANDKVEFSGRSGASER